MSTIYAVDVLMVCCIMGYLLWLPVLKWSAWQDMLRNWKGVRKEIIIMCRNIALPYAILCASC